MENGNETSRREERRIGFRDETDGVGFLDFRHDGSPEMRSGTAHGSNAMSMGRAGGMDGKSEKWHKLMQKIKMHDVEHRTPESIGDVVAILYDNLPGPDQRQTELLVAIIQAIAMHCSKN